MVKSESGDVVQQWALRIGEARTLMDTAASSVAVTIDDEDKKKLAPSVVRLLFDQTKEWKTRRGRERKGTSSNRRT